MNEKHEYGDVTWDAGTSGDLPPSADRGANLEGKLSGRYLILSELGRGGMGVVYRCHDTISGVDVAVKALRGDALKNPRSSEAVKANFALVERLHHPHIAALKTLEIDASGSTLYFIMEYIEGVPLNVYLRDHDGRLSLEHVVSIVGQIASGLDYGHSEKIIHRDIKPSNILIDIRGQAKILDFGIAERFDNYPRDSKVFDGMVSGTAAYMAPEQWRGHYQDGKTDQYSLAVLAYELLAGRCPFRGEDVTLLRESILNDEPEPVTGLPIRANAALRRALSKDRNRRFSSCEAFHIELAESLPVQPSFRHARTQWRSRSLVLILCTLIFCAAYLYMRRDNGSRAENSPPSATAITDVLPGRVNPPAVPVFAAPASPVVSIPEPPVSNVVKREPTTYPQPHTLPEELMANIMRSAMMKDARESHQDIMSLYRMSLEDGDPEKIQLIVNDVNEIQQAMVARWETTGMKDLVEALRMYGDRDDPSEYKAVLERLKRSADEGGNPLAAVWLGRMHFAGRCGLREDRDMGLMISSGYLNSLRQLARQEDTWAQFLLGALVEDGFMVEEDPSAAFDWFTKAAAQQDRMAEYMLGYLHGVGRGVKQDDRLAYTWFLKAAKQGLLAAQYQVGWLTERGRGTDQNKAEAFDWYQMAADRGLVKAMARLGFMYEQGEGIDQSTEKAELWYKRAEVRGYERNENQPIASTTSGLSTMAAALHQDGLTHFRSKNFKEALALFQKAADLGYSVAQNDLGLMHERGLGVRSDYRVAAAWFRLAADQNNVDGLYNLARLTERGRGVKIDPDKAFQLYLKSAENGGADAQEALGVMYSRGTYQVKKDPEQAVHWFSKAATAGKPESQYRLGILYERGEGVSKNTEEAIRLYKLAAGGGDVSAVRALSRLGVR